MESPNRKQWLNEIRNLMVDSGLSNKECLAQMRVIRDEVLTPPPKQSTVEQLAECVPSANLSDPQCVKDLAFGHIYKLFLQAQRAHPEAYEALKAAKPDAVAFYQGDDAGRFQGEHPRFYEFPNTKPFEPFRDCASTPVAPLPPTAISNLTKPNPATPVAQQLSEFYAFTKQKEGGFKTKNQTDWDNWLTTTPELLTAITRDGVLAYRDAVEAIPSNWRKKFPNKTLRQAMETDAPKIKRETIYKHFWRTKKFLEWLHLEGSADKDYSALVEMTKKAEQRVNDDRQPFSNEDISQILNGLEGERRDIVMLLAYTGARSGEIAALTPHDIVEHQGVKCLSINKGSGEDGALKTESSKRLVPVHPQLLPVLKSFKGFEGQNSDTIGNWLNKHIKRVLKDCTGKVTHSFRHTVATRLSEAGVEESDISTLLGHSRTNVTARYTHGVNMARLKNAIDKVRYELE